MPATSGTSAWPPSLPSVPTSRATRLTSDAKAFELIDHRVDGVLQLEDLALHVDGDLAREVALGDGGGHVGDVAHLAGEVRGHRVDVVGEILPGAGDAGHRRLAAELAFGADFARDAADFRREGVQLIDHRVDGVLELENLALHVDRDLARQVAARDGRRDVGDVAHLAGQVGRHRVDRVGQVLPRAGDTRHHGLAAELAFRADFAGDAGDLRGKAVQLIDHRVDGVLQLEDLALDVDGDLARQVAARDGGRDLGDIADLRRQVGAHGVDRVGQVLPGAGDVRHFGAAAQLAFGADFARDAADFGRERVQLIDHRVDGVLELENLALHVDGDLAREVAAGDGRRDAGDVSHLRRQVRRHRVDRVRQILPGAGDTGHDGLPAELAVRADLARDARHLGGKPAELVDHRVDGFLELQNLAADVDGDFLGEVAVGDGDRHVGDVAHLRRQVAGHLVHGFGQLLPHTRDAPDLRLAAQFAFGADLARDAGDFGREHRELIDHLVDELRRPQELAVERAPVDFERHRLSQVAFRHGADRAGDLRGGPHQVVDQHVDGGDFVGPSADHARHHHALFQLAFFAHHSRDARRFGRTALADRGNIVEGVGDLAVEACHVHRQPDAEVAVPQRQHRGQQLGGKRIRVPITGRARHSIAVAGRSLSAMSRGNGETWVSIRNSLPEPETPHGSLMRVDKRTGTH